jgi:hypothetical protein
MVDLNGLIKVLEKSEYLQENEENGNNLLDTLGHRKSGIYAVYAGIPTEKVLKYQRGIKDLSRIIEHSGLCKKAFLLVKNYG